MNNSGLLQGIGLFVCIGAILLVALIAFAARALSRGRNTTPQEPTVWNTPGDERPRYDQPDIKTQGGFGGVPSTGDPRPVMDRDFDRNLDRDRDRNPLVDREDDERASSGDRLVDYNRDRGRVDDDTPRTVGGFGGQQNDPPRRETPRRDDPRRDRADDDDVRSSGGFGGG